MPLTPADIHNTAFKRPPIGKRGYDEEEVDAFLDEVEQELTRLIEDNRSLHDQIRRGGGGASAAPGAPNGAALAAELSDLTKQLERLQEARARAEQNARSVQAQLERARNTPPPVAPQSPASGDERTSRVLLMAQRTADDHMRDAQREAEELMSDARTNSEKLTADAQVKAGTIESDARRNHTDAMNRLVTERANMLDEIDRLDQLARGYQAALNDHVAQQLQELNSAPELPV